MESSEESVPQDAKAEAVEHASESFDPADRGALAALAPHPLPGGVEPASPLRRLAAWALDALLVVVTLGVGWAIWAFTLGDGGQTPAKKLLGLRVLLSDQTQSAGLPRMFLLRWFVGGLVVPLVVLVTLGIILLMPFWDPRNRNLWDRLSSCVVVYDPDGRWDGPGERSRAARSSSGGPWRY